MGNTVIIAEKPSVGRDIAKVLKCNTRGDGFLKGENHIVTWAVGHLVSLQEPDELDEKYKKWRMGDLPILPDTIPLKVLPSTRSQFSIIKKLINDPETDSLICATDAGREGELIFRYIYDKAGCQKPFARLWISSMTDEAIKDGFASLRPGGDYNGLYLSAKARSESDWLVGMNLSRAFTLRYNTLLSIGRVQTPTLAILVKRHKEIVDFKPESYHLLNADFGDYKGAWFKEGQQNDTRLESKDAADAIAKKVKGKEAKVTLAETNQKQEIAPQLYDLTTLQRDANRLLSMTAQKTLSTAQSLYETHKAITYPRTDSRYLSKDMVGRTSQTLKALPAKYQPYVQRALPDGKLPFFKRVFDDTKVTDHHAILPTPKTVNLDKLSTEERNLFDLIARRALNAFYPPFVYDATKIITACEEETFRTTGRTIIDPGWRVLELSGKTKKDDDEAALPILSLGDTRKIEKVTIKSESTKPPSPHTDGTLLYAMEHAGREVEDEALKEQMKSVGLGTPATRAAIIERLCKVGYAARKGKTIVATDKGVQLISIVPRELASPEMTGKWEQGLEEIATNQQNNQAFISDIKGFTANLVTFAKENKVEAAFPEDPSRHKSGGKPASPPLEGITCPLCKEGTVHENSKAFYCSRYREGCKLTIWKNALERSGGPILSPKLVTLVLKDKNVQGSSGVITLNESNITFTSRANPGTPYTLSIIGKK